MTTADWLIYSEKWAAWYRPEAAGYTTKLAQAGRWSELEALAHVHDGITRAVHVSEVHDRIRIDIEKHRQAIAELEDLLRSA